MLLEWSSHARAGLHSRIAVRYGERRDNPPLAAASLLDPNAVAPFAATPMPVVDEMLKLASVGPSDFVVDLGPATGGSSSQR